MKYIYHSILALTAFNAFSSALPHLQNIQTGLSSFQIDLTDISSCAHKSSTTSIRKCITETTGKASSRIGDLMELNQAEIHKLSPISSHGLVCETEGLGFALKNLRGDKIGNDVFVSKESCLKAAEGRKGPIVCSRASPGYLPYFVENGKAVSDNKTPVGVELLSTCNQYLALSANGFLSAQSGWKMDSTVVIDTIHSSSRLYFNYDFIDFPWQNLRSEESRNLTEIALKNATPFFVCVPIVKSSSESDKPWIKIKYEIFRRGGSPLKETDGSAETEWLLRKGFPNPSAKFKELLDDCLVKISQLD